MLTDTRYKHRITQWFILPVVICGTLYLYYTPFNFKFSQMTAYVYDGLHFPGGIGLGLLLLAFNFPRQLNFKHITYNLLFLALFTALLEVLQPLSGRSAGVQDWLVGYSGCCLGLLLNVCLRAQRWRLFLIGVLASIAFTVSFNFKTVVMFKGYQLASERLPVITNFERTWIDGYMWRPMGWTEQWDIFRSYVDIEDEWFSEGEHSLRVTTHIGRMMGIRYPLNNQDWSAFHSFNFDVYNPGSTFDLVFRLYDNKSSFNNKQRFWRDITIQPGMNRFNISLDDIRHQSGERVLNLGKVKRIEFFVNHSKESIIFNIDNVHLN